MNVCIDDRGSQKALICSDCQSWLKWIGKKEMPLVIQYIREHEKVDTSTTIKINLNQPITYTLKTDRIQNLDDIKRVLEFLNIQVTINDGITKTGYEKVRDLFE